MKTQETGTNMTIADAARALGVSTKTIQRYLRKGLITKLKEGTRTYVPLSDIEALSAQTGRGQGQIQEGQQKRSKPKGQGRMEETVTLHRERYESLLIELGELRKQSQFLDDFRKALLSREGTVQNREKEIEDLRVLIKHMEAREMERDGEVEKHLARILELETELEKVKLQKPWWQK